MPEAQRPVSQMNAVAPDYFQVLHIPLAKGRTFTVRDDINAPRVMVVKRNVCAFSSSRARPDWQDDSSPPVRWNQAILTLREIIGRGGRCQGW